MLDVAFNTTSCGENSTNNYILRQIAALLNPYRAIAFMGASNSDSELGEIVRLVNNRELCRQPQQLNEETCKTSTMDTNLLVVLNTVHIPEKNFLHPNLN